MRTWLFALVVPGVVTPSNMAMAAPVVEPGAWRITWSLEGIQGRQGIPPEYLDLQTVTDTRCLDRIPALPLPPGQDRDCQIELVSAMAEAIEWQGRCAGAKGGVNLVKGKVTYRGSALDGAFSIEAGAVTLKYSVRGRLHAPTCR